MTAPLDRAYDRYMHDPIYRVHVDMMRRAIVQLELAPSELREAAMLAAYMEEMRRPLPPIPVGSDVPPFVRGDHKG